MVLGQLDVPIGQHQHGRQAGDPPHQEPQHVQGRLVGPVDVLDDEDGRLLRPVELGPQGVAHPTPVAGLERGRQRAADAARQVPERPQHSRRGQIVAVADEQARLGRQHGPHGVDQARLADPGLADDEHDRAVSGLGLLAAAASASSSRSRSRIAPPLTPGLSHRRLGSNRRRTPRSRYPPRPMSVPATDPQAVAGSIETGHAVATPPPRRRRRRGPSRRCGHRAAAGQARARRRPGRPGHLAERHAVDPPDRPPRRGAAAAAGDCSTRSWPAGRRRSGRSRSPPRASRSPAR